MLISLNTSVLHIVNLTFVFNTFSHSRAGERLNNCKTIGLNTGISAPINQSTGNQKTIKITQHVNICLNSSPIHISIYLYHIYIIFLYLSVYLYHIYIIFLYLSIYLYHIYSIFVYLPIYLYHIYIIFLYLSIYLYHIYIFVYIIFLYLFIYLYLIYIFVYIIFLYLSI